GPRGGLQNLSRHFSVDERVDLINRLSAAGLRRIEAVSFVNDTKVPRMAGAEEVLARISRPAATEFAALVMNERGVDRALACNLDEIRFVIVASETFSQRNQGAGIERTLATFEKVSTSVRSSGRRIV